MSRCPAAPSCSMPDAVLVDRAGARALARGDERGQRAAGGAVLDHAAARRRRSIALRQPEQVDEPVEHVGFELGAGGARRPQHALDPEPGRQKIAEDRGARGVGGEVGVEVGRLPVGEAGNDDLVEVAQHVREGLALLGRGAGQAAADPAGLRLGEHRVALHLLHVAGDALDDRGPASAELVRRHVLGFVHGKTFTLTAWAGHHAGTMMT